jgi:hypothetical protein
MGDLDIQRGFGSGVSNCGSPLRKSRVSLLHVSRGSPYLGDAGSYYSPDDVDSDLDETQRAGKLYFFVSTRQNLSLTSSSGLIIIM